MLAQPVLQARAVELAQGNQGKLHLKPGPGAQEPIDEDLAGMAEIHLVEPFVQGRDQHGGPEQVDRASTLPMPAAASRRTIRPAARRGQAPGRPGRSRPAACRSSSGNWRVRKLSVKWNGAGPSPARSRETRPSGPRNTTAGSRRKRSAMPTRWQKSARFVQQAMLTCWQLSTSSPVTGSVNELARPPSLGRLSSSVIRRPRPTKSRRRGQARQAAADDHHMRRGRLVYRRHQTRREALRLKERGLVSWHDRLAEEPLGQGSQGDRGFSPGGNRHPAVQHVVIAPGDLVEQGPVDSHDGQENGPADRVDQRHQIPRLVVIGHTRVGPERPADRGAARLGRSASSSRGSTPNLAISSWGR